MFDFRSPLMVWGAPAGLVLAALSWFGFHSIVYGTDLTKLEAWLREPPPAIHGANSVDTTLEVARVSANPIFALTTGPAAAIEPQLQLQGIAITPKGRSALLSVDGKPASWYEQGATRDGVTVMDVQSTRVTVDTVTRLRDVGLFDKPIPTAQGAAPPGLRSPPPPASAPSLPR